MGRGDALGKRISEQGSVEAIELPAHRGTDGFWHIDRLHLPAAGPWTIELNLLLTRFSQVSIAEQMELPIWKPVIPSKLMMVS